MAKLFEKTKIKDLELPNRFIRAATFEGMAGEDGSCTPQLIDYVVELAKGGVGLIITGHTYVQTDGQATPLQQGIYNDDLIDGLKEMAEAVHREGGRIILQLAHGGLQAKPKLTGTTPKGPSTGEGLVDPPGREMSVEEIKDVVDAFGKGASRAKEAGFDGVQIHGAHGYLLNQFLSPAFNHRTDNYGRSVENRVRILLEVLESIRRAVGRYYPVFLKINSQDFMEDGLSVEEFLEVGVILDRAGVDAIEVSGGTLYSGKSIPFRKEITYEREQAYFRKAAKALRRKIKAPVILVGGLRSYLLAERLVLEGFADYISLCRPFIREPHLIARWRSGDLRKATCISCNGCFGVAMSGQGIYCIQDRRGNPNG